MAKICPQNFPKSGENRQFQAKTPKYINRNIFGTINPTNKLFEDRVQTTKVTSWVTGGPPLLQSKYNMAGGRHLENRYDIIFWQWMLLFGRNSAAECRITRVLRRNGRDRNWKYNSNMADVCFYNRK